MIFTILVSLATSFIGSFLCFVIWVHFSFDDYWEAKKHHRSVAKGRKLEDEQRKKEGRQPLLD